MCRGRKPSACRTVAERARPRLRLGRRRVLSSLALRAPVGHAGVVALRPRLDGGATARTHVSLATVDMSRAWHSVDAVTHQSVRRTEDRAQLAVGHFVDAPP